jgi:hypothetical protein
MTEQKSQGGQAQSRQEFEREVLRRAGADAAFKRQLLADPKAALKAAYGIEISPEIDVQVLEETPSRFYIVLPVPSAELSDQDLAAVAGGANIASGGVSIADVSLKIRSLYFSGPSLDKF